MDTFQEFMSNSTPANRYIVEALGIVKGIVACKVIYACNLKDRVCRYGLTRMSNELGISKSTVSRTLEWLAVNGYIIQEQEHTDTTPGHYTPTEKLIDLLIPVAERNTPVAERNTPVAERNTPVAERNQDKNQITDSNKENPLSQQKIEMLTMAAQDNNRGFWDGDTYIPAWQFEEVERRAREREEKQQRDPVEDMVKAARRGVSEKSAPNSMEQWMEFRDSALKAAAAVQFMPNYVEKDDICKLSSEPTFDIAKWQTSLQETARHYSGGGKIARAIEVYQAGGTYAAWREKNYPQQQKGSNYNGSKNFGGHSQNATKTTGRIIPQSSGLGELAFPTAASDANTPGA